MKRRAFVSALTGAVVAIAGGASWLATRGGKSALSTGPSVTRRQIHLHFHGGPVDGKVHPEEGLVRVARSYIVPILRDNGMHEAHYTMGRIVGADWHLNFSHEV